MASVAKDTQQTPSDEVKEEIQDAWKKAQPAFESKRSSEYFDPCQEFANKSIKCMYRNKGDKDMCQDYFKAYRECKKEWTAQRKKARGSWFS